MFQSLKALGEKLRLPKNKKGLSTVTILVEILVASVLLPIIAVAVAGTTNLSVSEAALWGLTTIFIIIGILNSIISRTT